jgi:hypothetical protein
VSKKQSSTPGADKSSAHPRRWLVVQATALLESVSTNNYACYGRAGVPRYPAPPRASNGQEPTELCVEFMLRGADDALRLACLDLTLKNLDRTGQRVVWSGYHAPQHMQVIWIWDFYRIQSHVALRVAEPRDDAEPDAVWRDAVAAIRAAVPGDRITFDVRAACGDIHQAHTVTNPAKVWEPGK